MQTFKEIDAWVRSECPKCPTCQGDLGELQSFNYSGGVQIKNKLEQQWIYFVCLGCGYQWSLQKLESYVFSLERLRADARR